MRFELTPARPSRPDAAGVAGSAHKRIVAPSFDDDDSSGSENAAPAVAPPQLSRPPPDARRIASALFAAGEAEEEDAALLREAAVELAGDAFPWRGARVSAVANADADDRDREEEEGSWIAPGRPPVAKKASLPRVGIEHCCALRGPGLWRARGWRGWVGGGGGEVGVAGASGVVQVKSCGAAVERRSSFVDSLRVHAVAWAGGRGVAPAGSATVPGLGECFKMDSGRVADAVVMRLWEALEGEAGGHASVVFGLLRALYSSAGEGGGSDIHGNLLRRVVDWACNDASAVWDATGGEEAIREEALLKGGLGVSLIALTKGKVEEAVDAAIADGYLRLAMLIARASESDKTVLRSDAAAQLIACGGFGVVDSDDEDDAMEQGGGDCQQGVSREERMILALLAGNVRAVAHKLHLGWYRTFAMELLYGAGSAAALLHSERVSAAVGALNAVEKTIPPRPPHASPQERDAAYHLLRLYADPTASYPLSAGVFSTSAFGVKYDPMDARMPWLLHQTLSALVPRATLPDSVRLSDAYAAQLEAAGQPLWAFYVLCSGAPPACLVKSELLRMWPAVEADCVELPHDVVGDEGGEDNARAAGFGASEDFDSSGMDGGVVEGEVDESMERVRAYDFLVRFLNVPVAWLHEAKALHCRVTGDEDGECEHWVRCGTASGISFAQDLIVRSQFPRAVSSHDAVALKRITEWLSIASRGTRPANWAAQGGLVLDYLTHIAPETVASAPSPAADAYKVLMPVYRSMAERVAAYAAASSTPLQRHAVSLITDGIVSAERVAVLHEPTLVEDAMDDLEALSVSRATTRRVTAEYKLQMSDDGLAGAALFVSALPAYAGTLARRPHPPHPASMDSRQQTVPMEN